MLFFFGWDLAGWMRSSRVWMTSSREWMRSTRVVRASDSQCRIVATVLAPIPASSDTVESEGRRMKQWWISYKKQKNPYFSFFFLPWFSSLLWKEERLLLWCYFSFFFLPGFSSLLWKEERLLLWTGVLKRKPFPVSWRTRNQGKCVLPWRLGRVSPMREKHQISRRCGYITMDFATGASQNVAWITQTNLFKVI